MRSLITITIFFSKNIEISEIYNARDSEFELHENSININKFEVNGYLGLALQTKSQNVSMVDEEIIIKIGSNGEEKVINKKIKLFRPDLKLIHVPKKINIIKNDDGELEVQNRIIIMNCGNGTGLIKLKEKDSSELKIVDPEGIGELSGKIIAEFIERIEKLKDKYPQYSELIDAFIKTRDENMEFDKISEIKKLALDFTKAFETNREFMDDFVAISYISFINNLSFIAPLESLLKYLKSINAGRVIMSDAISILKVETSEKIFDVELTLSDLAFNTYAPIELTKIKIKSNMDCDVPINLLFEVKDDFEG